MTPLVIATRFASKSPATLLDTFLGKGTMELSDEQKKRILEEEQQRLAEEQYRTQVRQELRSRVDSPTAAPQKSTITKPLLLVAVAVVVPLCVWIFASERFSRAIPASTSVPVAGSTADSTPPSASIKPSPTS